MPGSAVGAVLVDGVASDLGREKDTLSLGRRIGGAVMIGDHPQPAVLIGF